MEQDAGPAVDRNFTLDKTLTVPAHISSLAFGHAGHVFAGCDDGSLRVYDLSSYKVLKAVRGLGGEVSSIVCMKRPGSELRDAWVAHGQHISKFKFDPDPMIQTLESALVSVKVGESDADVLNEVCGSVKFVPGRPRELISGGYDNILLHFDFVQGKVLSRRQIDTFALEGEISLSPPFVMSMAMSDTGVLAAGIADGRLWIGFGGEKVVLPGSKSSKKKVKMWEGLDEDQILLIKVAEGPIVAMAFSEHRKLTISTLMGVITQYRLIYDEVLGSVVLQQLWQKASPGIEKVNALIADEKRIIVGGFSAKGRGVIEVWKETPQPAQDQEGKSLAPTSTS
ncbi:hypothetical protein JR316_0003849 [Psilocybe cubensis]|uniref:Uncharacterized protein n=1 Tax=Psilocybe cubensis TaxID=181762 RepID=A0ACB8H8N4_PSICU|nr:hypothetical protein JR316_0003849 [Psilocybe cubensis]KAH9484368.1 hypothetical protein JR316_0003849 [Psilocybe cubensis]